MNETNEKTSPLNCERIETRIKKEKHTKKERTKSMDNSVVRFIDCETGIRYWLNSC